MWCTPPTTYTGHLCDPDTGKVLNVTQILLLSGSRVTVVSGNVAFFSQGDFEYILIFYSVQPVIPSHDLVWKDLLALGIWSWGIE